MLGKIIETNGANEGFGVAIANNEEAWYLETASGHHWVAARIPDKAYFVTANHIRLQHVDLENKKKFLSSPGLIAFAIEKRLYRPSHNKKFNFRKAFARISPEDITYNYRRIWVVQQLFNPLFKNDYRKGKFPVFMKPSRLLSTNDIEQALQNHYQNTKDDPYARNNPLEKFRPIAVFRAESSHIISLRKDLPPAIGNVISIALGMDALSLYIPFYQGISSTPKYYQQGSNIPDDHSAYWHYRKLQILAMQNFALFGPIVQKNADTFKKAMEYKQKTMEKRYLETYKGDPRKAQQLLQRFSNKAAMSGMEWCDIMSNKILDLQMKEIQHRYGFPGA